MFKKIFQFFTLFVLVLGIPIGLFIIQNQVKLGSKATGISANIIVDTQSVFPALSNWRNLSQGGEDAGGSSMLASVLNPLKKLNLSYIRIDHLYDYYDVVSRDQSGRIQFNWAKLDKSVDDITAIGAKPFLSLSYSPQALAQNGTDMPQNLNDWRTLVRATIEHYSGKNAKNISGVYYEVWNEPDLFGQFKTTGSKNYLDLYRASALGANDAQNTQTFKFGGPAITALYKNWLDALLTYSRDNKLRLDFFSWHRYSELMDDFESDAKNARIWAANYPEFSDIELVISESGLDASNNPDYDKHLSAIHTLATVATTSQDVEKLFSFEAKDGPGPSQYWGRWGLLTNEKYGEPVAKERYQAFVFLNNLGDERISTSGNGSWVKALAKKKGNAIQVLVVNYDPDGKHVESVPISFQGLTGKSFTLRRSDFGGRVIEVPTEVTGNTFLTVQFFPANSAAIIELIPR